MANIPLPSSNVPRRNLTGVFIIGRVHTVAANLSAADTMVIGSIPEGARLVGGAIKADTATGSLTVDVGISGTADLYLDGASAIATAESVASFNEGLGDVVSADTPVFATFLGAAVQAGTVITAWLEVTFDALEADGEAAV